MEECETRTQGAFVAGGYGRDRGRRIAPSSASRQPGAHFCESRLNENYANRARGASVSIRNPTEVPNAARDALPDLLVRSGTSIAGCREPRARARSAAFRA